MFSAQCMSRWPLLAQAVIILSFLLTLTSGSATSSCYGNSTTLDWYIDAVGETPCMTYQRLRQICDSNYQTPSWDIDAPTDQCDDPLSTCCCNSIAWSVRMLCINCQWDEFGTSDPGHSANAGAYYEYRWSTGIPGTGTYCGDGWNQTLPGNIQQTVCVRGIRLSDFLYSIFWPDGSWDFPTFEQLAEQTIASYNNQSLNYCGNSTNTTASTSSSSATTNGPAPPQTITAAPAKTNTSAIVGGTLGGALGLVLFGVLVAVLYVKRRGHLSRIRSSSAKDLTGAGVYLDPSSSKSVNTLAGKVTPFLGHHRQPSRSEQPYERTPSPVDPRSESGVSFPPHGSYTPPESYEQELYPSPAPPMVRSPVRKGQGKAKLWPRSTSLQPEMRDSDAGILLDDSRLPPEYRTVYSG